MYICIVDTVSCLPCWYSRGDGMTYPRNASHDDEESRIGLGSAGSRVLRSSSPPVTEHVVTSPRSVQHGAQGIIGDVSLASAIEDHDGDMNDVRTKMSPASGQAMNYYSFEPVQSNLNSNEISSPMMNPINRA